MDSPVSEKPDGTGKNGVMSLLTEKYSHNLKVGVTLFDGNASDPITSHGR